MKYGFIEWIKIRESNDLRNKKQEFVDRVYDVYKSNPSLSDKEIAKIVEPNYQRRITVDTRIPGILWTFRGLPELIKKGIAENPHLDNEELASLLQHTDKNVLWWMIHDVRGNIPRDKLYPMPTGTEPVQVQRQAQKQRQSQPEPTMPWPQSLFYEPAAKDQSNTANTYFGYGTGGGRRVLRKPPNS
jgi:hypothetical protein